MCFWLVQALLATQIYYFRLVLLVEKDERVMTRVAGIKESPSYSRVSEVFQSSAKRGVNLNGGGAGGCGKGNSGVITSGEMDWLVALDTVVLYEGVAAPSQPWVVLAGAQHLCVL